MHFRQYVQPYILVQAAVVGVEVTAVPLQLAVGISLTVIPGVVGFHLNAVLARLQLVSDVKAESHDTVLAVAHILAVYLHVGSQTTALKLNDYALALRRFGQGEGLAIPHYAVALVGDIDLEGLILIPCVRQGNSLGAGLHARCQI